MSLFPKKPGSEWHPLPEDYPTLTADGKRQARVAVCCAQRNPEELVEAWQFFREVYLHEAQPDGFFFRQFVPSPPFHSQMVADLAQFGRNLQAAPRGFAKSTLIGQELPLLLSLTRPYWVTSICCATDRLVGESFSTLMGQFGTNQKIIDDFGSMRPSKGGVTGRIWNHHLLQLENGSVIRGVSVTGRQRGGRPNLYILDDPEYDPYKSTDVSDLMEKFKVFLFRVIIPMLRTNCGIFWIGTIIPRSTIQAAVYGEDARFRFWNRRIWSAFDHVDDGHGGKTLSLLWSEMWPYDALMRRRNEIGASNFASEYLNRPMSDADRVFVLSPDQDSYQMDDDPGPAPLNSPAIVTHSRYTPPRGTEAAGWETLHEPLSVILARCFRMITVDYAPGLSPDSDYSAINVTGLDTFNDLWEFELWMGRERDFSLMQRVYDMGRKWGVHLVGVESGGLQKSLSDNVGDFIRHAADGLAWRPRVKPVTYPRTHSKSARIMGLEWRFTSHHIKLPLYLESAWPWSELFHEIRDFRPGEDTGLSHDDGIDTLAMTQYLVPGRRVTTALLDDVNDPIRHAEAGELLDAMGNPYLSDLSRIPPDLIRRLVDAHYDRRYNDDREPASLQSARVIPPSAGGT
jgi:hypothetical protein